MQQLQYVTVPLMCVCECVITAAVHICPFTLAGSRTGQPKAGLTKGGGGRHLLLQQIYCMSNDTSSQSKK